MFSLFGYNWNIDGPWGAPGGGTFQPANVTVTPDALVLRMLQSPSGSSVVSSDAEVCSTQKFGFGTFEFRAAVDPVDSGQVASGFLYYNNSETEIDVELTGNDKSAWLTNYSGVSAKQYTQVPNFNSGQFHDYKIVWQPSQVQFYIDGNLVATHTQDVPSAPAYFLFNLWGTNNVNWGGLATPGVLRQMFITSFSYTPLS